MAAQSREGTRPSGLDGRFSDALRPFVETALKRSVRDEPELWAKLISPVLGPAIRLAVAAAIRDMVQTIDQLVENSLSARSWRWRIESWRTGRPFSEVVLLRTLIYRVEQVLLVDRHSGLLLASVSAPGVVAQDTALISSMLTAIQEFMHDSFHLEQDDHIRQIHTEDFSLWVESGPLAAIAAAVRGNVPVEFHHILRAAVDLIHEELGPELRDFHGDSKALEARSAPILEGCLQARFQERKSGSRWWLWAGIGIVVIPLLWLGGLRIRHARQWNAALAALRETPGITVTKLSREHGKQVLEGLRDPYAVSAESVLAKNGIKPDDISIRFQPILSLHPTLLAQHARAVLGAPDSVSAVVDRGILRLGGAAPHEWILGVRNATPKLAFAGIEQVRTDEIQDQDLEVLRTQIEQVTILFDSGSSTIRRDQAQPLAGVAPKLRQWVARAREIGRVPSVHVVGHTDRTGSEAANAALSGQRAHKVMQTLLAAGIPSDSLQPVSAAGNSGEDAAEVESPDSPVRRKVVFRLLLGARATEEEKR